MRKNKASHKIDISILALDDDPIMTSTLQAYFERSGYQVDTANDPWKAIQKVQTGHYDILLLDFLMTPICGDQVVTEIRKFNREIFIVLLTGHKSMAPPIRTIRQLDIQGYYEKSDRFDQLELLVESCVKSIRQMRTIRSYQHGLSAIMDALPQVYHLQSTSQMAEEILEALSRLFSCTGCFLILAGPREGTGNKKQIYTRGQVQENQLAMEQNPTVSPGEGVLSSRLYDAEQQYAGILCVLLDSPPRYEQTQLFEVFAKQVSAAIQNSALHSLVNTQNRQLSRAYQYLGDSYTEMISAIRLMVDAKDTYTRGHSDRVSYLAQHIAQELGKDDSFCERVRMAGLFHDIGKMAVPDRILLKSGALTDEEYAVIKRHPEDGAHILSAFSLFRNLAPAVRAHHERVDGRGYPDGLKGEEIPLEARIIAVADAFDAMLSDRQYRKGMSLSTVIQELEKGKGHQFDPPVADALLRLIQKKGEQRVSDFMKEHTHPSDECTFFQTGTGNNPLDPQ